MLTFGLSVCLSVVLFTVAAAAAIVDDNWPGFAINYVDNCMSNDQQNNGRAYRSSSH